MMLLAFLGGGYFWIIPGVIVFLIAVIFIDQIYFVVLPLRYVRKYEVKDSARVIRYLERVLATPSLLFLSKIKARDLLIAQYIFERDYSKGAATCRRALELLEELEGAQYRMLEAHTRQQLANCLDGEEKFDEANKERKRASKLLENEPGAALRSMTRGKMLTEKMQFDEAYREFEEALRLTPVQNKEERLSCFNSLMTGALNLGKPELCLGWAERMIAEGATRYFLLSAHRMGGAACERLGRIDESEAHFRKAYEFAASENDVMMMSEFQSKQAQCLLLRGRLPEALELSIKAAETDPKGCRIANQIQGWVHLELGKPEVALACLEESKKVGRHVVVAIETQVVAVASLAMARVATECGRTDEAWDLIDEAKSALSSDTQFGLICDGVLSRVLAARGDAHASREISGRVADQLETFASDPMVQQAVCADLGMAAYIRGDYEDGVKHLGQFLALKPPPIYELKGYYRRGECYRLMGMVNEARRDYRAAIELGIDSHAARLAKQQYREPVGG